MRRRRPGGGAELPVAALIAGLLTLGACTGSDGSSTTASSAPSATPVDRPAAVPADVFRAAVATIAAVNAADASPEVQRAVLLQHTEPGRRHEFDTCRTSTTTIEFTPAWSQMRRAPGPGPDRWILPTLITIRSSGREIGTDVTALSVSIAEGGALLPPLCVR